ncbi:MAG: GTP-binding protein [Pseudomonadales bacterium]
MLYTLAPPVDASPRCRVRGREPGGDSGHSADGLLGAGKATLLCRLLDASSEAVLAIVNDLATLNVDAMRVRETDRETLQLENGCACCVLGSDLDAMLSEISRRATPPQRIVVEASGVSDPGNCADDRQQHGNGAGRHRDAGGCRQPARAQHRSTDGQALSAATGRRAPRCAHPN